MEIMKKALEFYANEGNYSDIESRVNEDKGFRARITLEDFGNNDSPLAEIMFKECLSFYANKENYGKEKFVPGDMNGPNLAIVALL